MNPATSWQLRTQQLTFTTGPAWMGIVNVTPDSFSDGGQFFDSASAIRRAEELLAEGADILDIGGESTRPYATPVSEDEELRRVLPVIAAIRKNNPQAIISIDTTKPVVAAAAIEAGAEIINDITGLADPRMMQLAVDSRAGVCAMHIQGTPQTMQDRPHYDDVVREVYEHLELRRDQLLAAGVERERICLDPGIGFGKTHEHSITLVRNCAGFHQLGCPILVGHSRKGFIGQLLGDKTADRSAGTLGASLALALQGVQIIRLHEIRATREAWQLLRAMSPQ
ncbi:dihydropteroate synthase [Anatilimnocola floriformis]|uniref:dihydropteroate synthase n=1 Tax=Anatilimnocola floriformis TaxID=2948575 RepID=UPI0020C285C6|nr:dihydropteroate synthase [Anatilimnocola floriformis]